MRMSCSRAATVTITFKEVVASTRSTAAAETIGSMAATTNDKLNGGSGDDQLHARASRTS